MTFINLDTQPFGNVLIVQETWSSASPISSVMTLILDHISFTSDIYFQKKDFSITVKTEQNFTIDGLKLICSVGGTTTITHKVIDLDTDEDIDWLTVNPSQLVLTGTAPSVASDTTYNLAISSVTEANPKPVYSLVELNVISCTIKR